MKSFRLNDATARRLGRALRSGDEDLRQLAARLIFRVFGIPPAPTDAVPGSEEKLSVMAERVAAGCSPFHPLDPRLGDLPDGAGLVVREWRKCALPRVMGVVRLQGEAKG